MTERKRPASLWTLMAAMVAAMLLLGGCSGVRHLHPNTGRAYTDIFRLQRRSVKTVASQMSGEDAELAMENMGKKTKISEFKQSGNNFLLPLQR